MATVVADVLVDGHGGRSGSGVQKDGRARALRRSLNIATGTRIVPVGESHNLWLDPVSQLVPGDSDGV
jgi:hypothetical protein